MRFKNDGMSIGGRTVLIALAMLGSLIGVGAPARAQAPAPDLTFQGPVLMVPASATAGQLVTFTATVINQGNAATPADVPIATSFRIDKTIHAGTDKGAHVPLAPGATVSFSANWVATAGTHTMSILIHKNAAMGESDYSNNKADQVFSVAAAIPPIPTNPRIMTLGDSMTAGYGGTDIAGYRGTFYQSLVSAGYTPQMVGQMNCGAAALLPPTQQLCDGVGGSTIAQLDTRVQAGIVASENPDVVLLLIGFNSVAYTGNTIAEDQAELAGVIDDIMAQKPTVHLIVASLIDSTQCCSEALLAQYNAGIPAIVAAKAAQGYAVTFVDMWPVVPSYDLYDYVHPDDAGYVLMAAAWMQAFQAIATPP